MNNADIENIASSLNNELVLLNLKWAIYKELFENKNRKHLLAETSPIVFTIFQKLLLDDIAVTLCRITEPAKSRSHQNSTLDQLLTKKGAGKTYLNQVNKELGPVKALRDKFLAHRDLYETLSHFIRNTSGGRTALNLNFPLPIRDIEKIIGRINGIMNTATDRRVLYEHIETSRGPDGGVKRLIDVIKAGLFYDQMEKKNKLDSIVFFPEWQNFEYRDA